MANGRVSPHKDKGNDDSSSSPSSSSSSPGRPSVALRDLRRPAPAYSVDTNASSSVKVMHAQNTNGETEVGELTFLSTMAEADAFVILKEEETIFDGLSRMDPSLISTFSGRRRIFKRKRVQPGCIGLGDSASHTLFFRPGAYTRIGIGRTLRSSDVRPLPGPGGILDHGDVTYIHLREDQLAVVSVSDKDHVIGHGRYIVRQPNYVMRPIINVRTPGEAEFKQIILESSVPSTDGTGPIDTREVSSERAGFRSTVGSIQFCRAEPGYAYAIQSGDGVIRTGEGVTALRKDEKFVDWLNIQRTTRTTAQKMYASADSEECAIKLQLQWQLVDGQLWIRLARSFEDAFDFLEEMLDAYVNDEIGSRTRDELDAQRLDKFDQFESTVIPTLSAAASEVGVRLISMEVRYLRFPVADTAQRERKELEVAEQKEKRAREHASLLQRKDMQQMAEAADAELARAQTAAQKEAEIAAIGDERALAKVDAQSIQREREILAEQSRVRIEGETQLLQAEAAARVEAVAREQEAEASLRIAKLEAEAARVRGEAEAEAAARMAAVFVKNPQFLQYKQLEFQSQIEMARVKAIASYADNPNAILPAALQRELLLINEGIDPRQPMFPPTLSLGGDNANISTSGRRRS